MTWVEVDIPCLLWLDGFMLLLDQARRALFQFKTLWFHRNGSPAIKNLELYWTDRQSFKPRKMSRVSSTIFYVCHAEIFCQCRAAKSPPSRLSDRVPIQNPPPRKPLCELRIKQHALWKSRFHTLVWTKNNEWCFIAFLSLILLHSGISEVGPWPVMRSAYLYRSFVLESTILPVSSTVHFRKPLWSSSLWTCSLHNSRLRYIQACRTSSSLVIFSLYHHENLTVLHVAPTLLFNKSSVWSKLVCWSLLTFILLRSVSVFESRCQPASCWW